MSQAVLYYVHDPMCSWCWGYRPTWQQLRAALPEDVVVENVLGGLAPDNDRPMPADLRDKIKGHWKRIQSLLDTEFNFDFWSRCKPRRDTYKACRAVVVAARHGLEEEMIEAIQSAYYLRAMNPSVPNTLAALAAEIGLDPQSFRQELRSPVTEAEFCRHLALTQQLGVSGFPSLVLEQDGHLRPIPVDFRDPEPTLEAIRATLRA